MGDMEEYEQDKLREDAVIDARNELIQYHFNEAKESIETLLSLLRDYPEYSVVTAYLEELVELCESWEEIEE